MASKAQTSSQGSVNESMGVGSFDTAEFDQWVKAVKQQMIAALRKRGSC